MVIVQSMSPNSRTVTVGHLAKEKCYESLLNFPCNSFIVCIYNGIRLLPSLLMSYPVFVGGRCVDKVPVCVTSQDRLIRELFTIAEETGPRLTFKKTVNLCTN